MWEWEDIGVSNMARRSGVRFGLRGRARERASPGFERARQRFDEGTAHFEEQNYALALVAFQESYNLLQGHPRQALVLYNIGRCDEELGRFREARDAYRRYLREAGDDAEHRDVVEVRLRDLETRVELGSGGGPSSQPAPPPANATAAPSTDEPGAESSPAPGASSDDTLLFGGIATAVVGGLGLAAFGVVGGLALNEYSGLQNDCGASHTCTSQDVSTLSTLDAVADAMLAVGLTGAAVTAVLLALWASSGTSGDQASNVTFWASSAGAGAGLRGSF